MCWKERARVAGAGPVLLLVVGLLAGCFVDEGPSPLAGVASPGPAARAPGPIARLPDPMAELPDLLGPLSNAQRAAARALGEARRQLDAGRLDAAREALDRAAGVELLAGYAELIRIRLLLAEGAHAEAYRRVGVARASAESEALRAALGVLEGEALARIGDARGAELAWSKLLEAPGAEDAAVRETLSLAIVASRQRTGSLDATLDPRVLLDRNLAEIAVATRETPVEALSASALLSRAEKALGSGQPERARILFDRALTKRLDPERRREARLGRAHALFRERRYRQATEAFQALLPDLEARFWLARSLARSGRIEASIETFEAVTAGDDPALASRALYLKGTLHDDRGETGAAIDAFARAAGYGQFPERARQALWREGWARFRAGDALAARRTFETLAARCEDPIERLRPRYWAARAAAEAGQAARARRELEALARGYPLSYYGWRAQQRLALDAASLARAPRALAEGTRRVDDRSVERAALLIEAGLADHARDELRFAARSARGLVDRIRVGTLLARVGDYHRASELVVTAYSGELARGLQPGREALWWLSWPPAYRDTLEAVFPEDAAIEPALVWAIMREESHYRVDARSAVGALGLLQLMPETAAQLARERGLSDFVPERLFEPETNIALGAAYLDQLASRFDGRLSAAIGSYNAGPRKVASWLEGDARRLDDDVWVEAIPYDQTRAYVKRVLRSLHVYRTFYR